MGEASEPQLHYLEYYEDFLAKVRQLSRQVQQGAWQPEFIIGLGRGGLVPAVYISHQLSLPMLSIDHSSKIPGFADELLAKVAAMSADGTRMLFVDDINDTGGTIDYIRSQLSQGGCDHANLRFAVVINNKSSKVEVDVWADMIDRTDDKRWFVFPWESVGSRDSIVDEALSVPERLA